MRRLGIAPLLIAAMLLNSCALFTASSQQNAANAGFAAYVKASKTYKDDAVKYKVAHDIVRAASLTTEQTEEYRQIRSDVRAADNDVYADLEQWEQDGVEPAEFKTHRSKLKAAQTRMILLSREITSGGAR